MNLFIKWYRGVVRDKSTWLASNQESYGEEECRYRSSPFSLRDYDWAMHMQNIFSEKKETRG